MRIINNFYPILKQRKYFVCYLLVTFSVIFCSNIVMHLILSPKVTDYKEVFIKSSDGYQVNGSQFTRISEDPKLYISYEEESIQGIRLEFEKPLMSDMNMQIYFPDANLSYAEDNSMFVTIPADNTEVEIDIPSGNYGVLRLDIDGDFQLKRIMGNFLEGRVFLYSVKSIRLIVWGVCFLFSFLLCGILYHIPILRKGVKNGCCYFSECVFGCITLKMILKVLVILLLNVFVSLGVEFVASFIRDDSSFNIKEFYIICAFLFVVFTMIRGKKWYSDRIEFIVGGVILIFGITFSLVMPVSNGLSWDDEIHYSNIITKARFNSEYRSYAEYQLPKSYQKIIYNPSEYERKAQEINREEYNQLYQSGKYIETGKESFSIKDVGYIPAVIGTWISWGLCLSFTDTIILTRIINVLFFAVMISLSMKNVKSGKMLIAVFALIPTVFFLASSFSYDTWLTVMLIYGFSRYFRELQNREEPLTWGRFFGIFIPLTLALGPKIVYAPLLFLTAYMPKSKFKDKKWHYAYRACFICVAAVMAAVLCYVASGRYDLGMGDTRGGETVNAMQQLLYIKTNFGEFYSTLRTFLKGYFSYENSVSYLTFMAYMGVVSLQWIPLLLLFFTALTDRLGEDAKTIPVLSKLFAVVMYVMIGAICAVVMYISFTPVGSTQIAGCQGRYILPAVLPVLYMISRFGGRIEVLRKVKAVYYNMILIGISAAFLMYNLWVNCAVKY